MITVLTGNPGSGKTLYAIAKLLQPLIGTFVEATDDEGNKVKHERVLFTNINGLALPHEKVDAEWLAEWHKHVKPGAIICYDEAQKAWPKRVTGSKVPPAVAELETHRHYGVDFVVMTQKPELMDQNVCSLAGRHLHIRRVGNTHNAIVYEWDACSRALLYKNAFAKKGWRYPRKVFEWYKSAEAHTKMPRSIPFVAWILLVAVAGSAFAWPTLMGKITQGLHPEQKAAQALQAPSKPATPSLVLPDAPAVDPGAFSVAAASTPSLVNAAPTLMGCVATQDACRCYDQAGQVAELDAQICRSKVTSPTPVKSEQELAAVLPAAQAMVDRNAPSWTAADVAVVPNMRQAPGR